MHTAITVSAAMLAMASCAQATILTYDASLGTLPQAQGWTFQGNTTPASTISGGVFQYGPTSVNGTTYWEHNPVETVNFATHVSSIEAEIQLSGSDWGNISGFRRAGFALMLTDDAGRWVIAEIGDNRISLGNDNNRTSDPFAVVDFTQSFRSVRLEAGPAGGRLFVDGVLQLTLALGTGMSGGAQGWFGDGTILANADSTSIRSVTYSAIPTPGAAVALALLPIISRRKR
jgi:hypothetical protein